jgi:branched-subunit amino acid transport protein
MTWIVLLAVGLGSYAFRLAPLLLFHRITLSERGDRMIRDAGLAAITALIAVSAKQSATTAGSAVPVLAALAVGVVLAARGASMLVVLAVGGATYAGALILVHGLA